MKLLSFIRFFLFDSTDCSPGMYRTSDGTKFKGSRKDFRDGFVSKENPNLLPFFHQLDKINVEFNRSDGGQLSQGEKTLMILQSIDLQMKMCKIGMEVIDNDGELPKN